MRTHVKVLAALAVVGVAFGPAIALGQGPSAQAGKSDIAHLYLVAKDANFEPVPGGAWGKLKYAVSGPAFAFVFNAHMLDAGVHYTLIYYPDPFPGRGAMCFGTSVANATGDIHVQGSVDTGSLPIATDWNADPSTTTVPGPPPVTGAKIWLVLATDVSCSGAGMIGWRPAEYLFEMQLINYTKTP